MSKSYEIFSFKEVRRHQLNKNSPLKFLIPHVKSKQVFFRTQSQRTRNFYVDSFVVAFKDLQKILKVYWRKYAFTLKR